jgi:hypothetical protein
MMPLIAQPVGNATEMARLVTQDRVITQAMGDRSQASLILFDSRISLTWAVDLVDGTPRHVILALRHFR